MSHALSEGPVQAWLSLHRRWALSVGGLLVALLVGVGIMAVSGIPLPFASPQSFRVANSLEATIASQGVDAAVAQFQSLRARGFAGQIERESDTNALGYQLLGKGRNEDAVKVFRLNVEQHPDSLLRLQKQAEIRRLRGKLDWQGDLEAMRTDR